jgi:ribosome-binding ATPase
VLGLRGNRKEAKSMKAGLVGYAQTGKTTLFNALTGQNVQTGGGGKSKSNLGVIKVPDERLTRLTSIYRPRRTVPAEILFVDVPGPRAKGSGIDGVTIQALQEMDALAVVLRGFPSLDGTAAQPVRELADFDAELILNDLGVVERRLERLAKERGSDRQRGVLAQCLEHLNAERSLRSLELSAEDEREISSFAFLSRKPRLAVLNTTEAEVAQPIAAELAAACRERHIELVSVCASLEAEIATLPAEDQAEFLASLGIAEAASARLIRAAYALLDYISFFTVGEDEVRAWTVYRGSKAPKAAGRVHSDIERGFIRAEVMAYDEFIPVANEAKMRDLGKLRVEGKEYIMQDGDIVNFRFAV